MVVISVTGTSGVGKSFLVKQLASYLCIPAFFEGEEGTIPKEILDDVFSSKDPSTRYDWFLERSKKMLTNARTISNQGIDCIVDAAPIASRAIVSCEDEKYLDILSKQISSLDKLEADKTLLLILSGKKLFEFVESRGRETEKLERAMKRNILIQNKFLELAKNKDIIIIDRTKLDFSKEKDLKFVLKKLNV